MMTGDCNCPLLSVGRSARPASDALASMALMSRSTGTDLPLCRSNQTLCLCGSAITIDSLFEWRQPDAEQMVAKAFIRLSVFQIQSHDVLDHRRHLGLDKGRADDPADGRCLVGAPAKRDLVMFNTLLVDTQNADIGGVVMPAGIDAALNIQPQLSDFGTAIRIGTALKYLFGKWQ